MTVKPLDLSRLKVFPLSERMHLTRADEILVDLMASAGGIDYAQASPHVVVRDVDGVAIPFAAPRLLWRMKAVTRREQDAGDLMFLRYWFEERGEAPPE